MDRAAKHRVARLRCGRSVVPMCRRVHALRAAIALGLGMLCGVTASCVVIPLPATPLDKVIIDEATLASIEVGRDTRDSVSRLLGAPQLRSPDDRRWVYRTRVYDAEDWQYCVLTAWGGSCDKWGPTHQELLDARFSPEGALVELELATTDESGCTDSGICVGEWPRALALYAESAADHGPTPSTAGGCTVYAYLADPDSAQQFAVQLGTNEAVLWVQHNDYVKAVTKPGPKRLWAVTWSEMHAQEGLFSSEAADRSQAMATAPWVALDIDCGPDQIRYFRLEYTLKGEQRILEVASMAGAPEIARRRELIAMDASNFPFLQPVTPEPQP